MPSLFTSNGGIELPADGEKDGVWGDVVNLNMQIVDRLTNGVGLVALTGTSHTLTTSDGVLSDGQYGLIVFGGAPTGANTVTLSPNDAEKIYFVRNTTAESVIITQGSGGNVTVPAGAGAIVYANGAGTGAAVADLTATFVPDLSKAGITASAAELNILDGVTADTAELNILDGVTADTAELNILDGVTADTAELNILDGVTADTAELNILDGVTATTGEINYLAGVTGPIQTQIDDAGDIKYTRHTANITATPYEGIIADTSGGAFTVTLPTAPSIGDTVVIADGADWSTTNLIVGRNGSTIEGDAVDMIMDIGGVAVQFTYDGTTWQIYAQVGANSSAVLVSGDNVSELTNDAGYLTPTTAPDLTQVQVEDDTSTVFGQVSGERLAQATTATLNASGAAPVYACRAWVNFNGTGTVAIRASGNVSSITDNGVGDYTINFAAAMPDANYSAAISSIGDAPSPTTASDAGGYNPTASSISLRVYDTAGNSFRDGTAMSVVIFR